MHVAPILCSLLCGLMPPQSYPAVRATDREIARSAQDWPRWGGPNGDFKVASIELALWPADGPKRLWDRTLGDGFSCIVADGSCLYTMYRDTEDEVVIALEQSTGKTIWEYRYAAPPRKEKWNGYLGNNPAFGGQGPRATPLIAGDRLYSIGYTAKLHCLDKWTGKVLWSHDLIADLEGWIHECGYSASPVQYKATIILPLGSTTCGIAAFDCETGTIVWKSPPFPVTDQESQGFQATPVLIRADGEDQLVFMSPIEVIGVDPADGQFLWTHAHRNQWQYNCVTPLWGNDGVLYVTSHADGGSRALHVQPMGAQTRVTELWHNPRIGLYHNNGIRVGNNVYGCAGAFFYAQDMSSGEVVWKQRGFSESSFVYAGGKLIFLDENGVLGLAAASRDGLVVHAKFQLFPQEDGESWTAPTLINTTLYVRNRRRIVALELPTRNE